MPYEAQPEIKLSPEEEAIAELKGKIEAELRVASHNAMKKDQNEKIIFRDDSGNVYEYIMSPEEALQVDKALWSAGEDMTIENLREQILLKLKSQKFDLQTTNIGAPEQPIPYGKAAWKVRHNFLQLAKYTKSQYN